jgi:hypothetical protein
MTMQVFGDIPNILKSVGGGITAYAFHKVTYTQKNSKDFKKEKEKEAKGKIDKIFLNFQNFTHRDRKMETEYEINGETKRAITLTDEELKDCFGELETINPNTRIGIFSVFSTKPIYLRDEFGNIKLDEKGKEIIDDTEINIHYLLIIDDTNTKYLIQEKCEKYWDELSEKNEELPNFIPYERNKDYFRDCEYQRKFCEQNKH